jgi:acyl-CoA hydrolase
LRKFISERELSQVRYDNHDRAATSLVQRLGKEIVIGVPLGLGKPIGLLNALYRLASQDPTLKLTIITGLTLSRPRFHNELEARFIGPILNRIIKDYEDPLYESARESQQLPKNINVIEFFLSPGKYLHNNQVQQNYISSSYTNVVNDVMYYGINVVAQCVSSSSQDARHLSLSSNTDLFKDVASHLRSMQRLGKEIAIVAEINANLPFMLGDALMKVDDFTDIIDTKHYRALFALPHDELSPQDHMIGLYTSCLIKDDSCLQVGIGKLSNAVANALIMRHEHNDVYQDLLKALRVKEKFGQIVDEYGASACFERGLYASTEMVSDEYVELYKRGILKKRVYDEIGLQRLLNERKIDERVTPEMLDVLIENKIIHAHLTAKNITFLKKFGIIHPGLRYQDRHIILPCGERLSTDLNSPLAKQHFIEKCLGVTLQSGKIIHAGFFLGTNDLYQALRDMTPDELQQIEMTKISRTNTLYWSPELAKLQRKDARLVNSCMMVTLGGVVISDGLENLCEVSGVGGQFDFIYMAHQLPDARSIINCRSTRGTKANLQSNIIWEYANATIPRYLRDIVVTEYGIADCRSKTDSEVIKSMLCVADSSFQQDLLKKAKKFGKLGEAYDIPASFNHNCLHEVKTIVSELQRKGYCKPYPFGCELTDEERVLKRALLTLKRASKLKIFYWLLASFFMFKKGANLPSYLRRMQLDHPCHFKERVYKKLLSKVLQGLTNRTM